MDDSSTPSKRRRRDDDDKETPRASTLPRRSAPSSASSSPTKSSVSVRSTTSRLSSRHRLSALEVQKEGIITRQLEGATNLPVSVQSVLRRIHQLERCRGILASTSDRDKFHEFLQDNDLDDTVFAATGATGSTLSPDDALEIQDGARRCFERNHDEDNWTAEVHFQLCRRVFRKSSLTYGRQLVDFCSRYVRFLCPLLQV